LEVVEADLLLQAIVDYDTLNVDFIDAYNAAWMKQQKLTTVYSFDRQHFSRFTGLTLKEP
jgi:predicted nucleic acid-binding protein